MTHQSLLRSLKPAALCLGLGMLLTSCFTEDYDIDGVDLTMGLGSDGLALKIGDTDSIKLGDLLEVDETIKTEPGESNNHPYRYYLVKDGTTDFDFSVDPVSAEFEKTVITTSYRVMDYDQACEQWKEQYGIDPAVGIPLEVKTDFAPHGTADGDAITDFTIKDISTDILEVRRAHIKQTEVSVALRMVTSPNVKFRADRVKDFKFTLPKFIKIDRIDPGWVLEGNVLHHPGFLYIRPNQPLCTVVVSEVDMTKVNNDGRGVMPDANGEIKFQGETAKADMSGDVYFVTDQNFTMQSGDYADVELEIKLGTGEKKVYVESAEGRFNPAIDPVIDPIDISGDLPEFLQDPGVRIKATNPTLKFDADMAGIPVGLDFGAKMTAVKTGASGFNKVVELPAAGINAGQQKVIYYYQGAQPYDPEGAVVGAEGKKVNNLGSLIEQLPDRIEVELKDRTVVKHGTNDYFTIHLDPNAPKRFEGRAAYSVYVPFEFEKGLTIVYNDSTDSMNDDLKDYTAHGLVVSGQVENSIPLELVASLEALDLNGNPIPGVTFSTVKIAAGTFGPMPAVNGRPQRDGYRATTTPVTIEGKLSQPALLQKVDRLAFRIKAEAMDGTRTHDLLSTQYLKFVDLRLRLTGQITANFN